jgi:hypothetical protein
MGAVASQDKKGAADLQILCRGRNRRSTGRIKTVGT